MPERVASESAINEAAEGFFARLVRQISDAQVRYKNFRIPFLIVISFYGRISLNMSLIL